MDQKISDEVFFKKVFCTLLETLHREWNILSPNNYEILTDYLNGISKEELLKKYSIEMDKLEDTILYARLSILEGIRFYSTSAIPIDMVGLSNRAKNALVFGRNIRSLSELSSYSKDEVKKFPGVGETIIKEIESKLIEFGFSFR